MLFRSTPTPSEELAQMLRQIDEQPEREQQIARWIHDRFERTLGLLVLDMSGFTEGTRRGEVVPFLRKIRHMQELVYSAVHAEAGRVVNTLADSVACVFPDAEAAVDAARAMVRRLDATNASRGPEDQYYISVGIGYGRTLVVGDDAIFGGEVNACAKLGEDVARRREILLTEAAWEQVQLTGAKGIRRDQQVSDGLTLTYYQLVDDVEGTAASG